ncbi:MAG: flagellar basal body protein [Bacteroidota bacterium]
MTTPSLRLLQNAMQAYTWRLKALSSNVANLDTPGYNRLSVTFEESLQTARRSGMSPTRDHVAAQMVQDGRPPVLEDELMELADTQMRTQLATRALHEHFARLRTGITGRQG